VNDTLLVGSLLPLPCELDDRFLNGADVPARKLDLRGRCSSVSSAAAGGGVSTAVAAISVDAEDGRRTPGLVGSPPVGADRATACDMAECIVRNSAAPTSLHMPDTAIFNRFSMSNFIVLDSPSFGARHRSMYAFPSSAWPPQALRSCTDPRASYVPSKAFEIGTRPVDYRDCKGEICRLRSALLSTIRARARHCSTAASNPAVEFLRTISLFMDLESSSVSL